MNGIFVPSTLQGGVLRAFLAVAVLVCAPFQAYAWGPEGHSIVAEIAQRRLTPRAAARVREIMGGNASLASISSWADDYRALHRETSRWHFVDIPLGADDYVAARDCGTTPEGDCLIAELARNLKDLKDPATPDPRRRDALKFIVHFVGDVNQPLHAVGELTGYNEMRVCYFSSLAKNDCASTNLYAVWDYGLIRSMFYDWGAYADYLDGSWMAGQDVAVLSAGTPVDWALEAHKAARETAVAGVAMNDNLGTA